MSMLSDGERRKIQRGRMWKFAGSILAIFVGGLAAAAGFALAQARPDGDARTYGILCGVGVGFVIVGLVVGFKTRPWDRRWMVESTQTRRDRLQTTRTRQLSVIPIVTFVFMAQASTAIEDVLAGEGRPIDYLRIAVPVIYAWLVAAIVMGWDAQSRQNRKYMEDELTQVHRAKAVTAGFVVLMVGATVALGLGLWRAEMGVVALPFVLASAGAATGLRFAWLDREALKDG